VGVACEYRLSGEAAWPAQIHDVKAAVRWMRANADRLGIDPDKICVTGNSAGAHLALMLGCDTDEFEGAGGNADAVVPCDESFNMYHALNRAGAAVELHVFEGAPHGFDSLAEFAKMCVQLMVLYFDRKVVDPRPVTVPDET